MARPPSTQPTDAELEILNVLWDEGPAGLGQIHARIRLTRQVALTTIATTLKTMLAKKLVTRGDGPSGYLWSAELSRVTAASGMLGKLLDHLFNGSAQRLVAHLIQEDVLSEHDRQEIRALFESLPAERPKKGGRR